MAQVKIQFVEDYEIQDEHRGTDKATRYKKGKRLTCSEDSARHFVESKGVALRVGKQKKSPSERDAGLPGSEGQTAKPTPEGAKDDQTLIGSDIQPGEMEIGAATVMLGEIVAEAHRASFLSVEEWNALDQEDREARIQEAIDIAREAAAAS